MKQFTILATFALIAFLGVSMAHKLEKRSLWGDVPADTPEVQHAKALHFQAHAAARAAAHAAGPWDDGHDYYAYAPQAYSHHGSKPIHIPVIHNGVPTETPEVQHAKALHFKALYEASARSGHGGYDHGHDDGSYHHGHHNQW